MTDQEEQKKEKAEETYIPLWHGVLEIDAMKGHAKTVHGGGESLKSLDGKFVRAIFVEEISAEQARRYSIIPAKSLPPTPIYEKRKSIFSLVISGDNSTPFYGCCEHLLCRQC